MNQILVNKSIALFGTSADPPTAGHQTILSWLAKYYDLVVVWASDNPFKANQTELKIRSEMLNLIIQEIKPPKSNIVLNQDISDRRTLITVEKARSIWDNADFTFVIGADLVKQIITWYRVEQLFDQVKILIIPRAGYSFAESDLAKLKSLGGDYKIATLNAPRVSSSIYRLRGDIKVITPPVLKYIQDNNLYAETP